jgi:hypothetical protein
MQNKANFNKLKIDSTFFVIRSCENKPRLCKPVKQSQTKPISLPPKSAELCTGHAGWPTKGARKQEVSRQNEKGPCLAENRRRTAGAKVQNEIVVLIVAN